MRPVVVLALVATVTAAPADAGDIPMVAIGLPFSPEAPVPVATDHVLYHDVRIEEIRDLPPTVKSSGLNFIAAAKRSSINIALRESFQRMNLAAADASTGRKRLVTTWVGSRTPFRIATTNATTVTLRYRLERVDTGQPLFEREITTSVSGGGADASMRDNGIVRAAIAANFASAANCIDRAAYGTAPADCALKPGFSVSVVRVSR